jgi:hypothetical protein
VAKDNTIAVRSAMLALMKADAPLVALVPKASIFSQWTTAVPAYPFIRSGPPSGTPLAASCVDGQTIIVAMHAFSAGITTGGKLILPAEDHAGQIGAAIAAALDRKSVAVPGGRATIRWTGNQLLQDPEETQVYHAVVNLRVRCITA